MSPSFHSEVISLKEVPNRDFKSDSSHRRPAILVVDDEPLVADTLTMILSRAGYTAFTAYDGNTALKLAGEYFPDLLISDVAMPNMNGVELTLAMLEFQPQCKIILFSAHATSADLVNAIDARHNVRLLAKPIHPTEMLRYVSKTLGVLEQVPQPIRMAEVISIRRRA